MKMHYAVNIRTGEVLWSGMADNQSIALIEFMSLLPKGEKVRDVVIMTDSK